MRLPPERWGARRPRRGVFAGVWNPLLAGERGIGLRGSDPGPRAGDGGGGGGGAVLFGAAERGCPAFPPVPLRALPRPGCPPGRRFPEPAPSRPRGPVTSSAQNFPLPGRLGALSHRRPRPGPRRLFVQS